MTQNKKSCFTICFYFLLCSLIAQDMELIPYRSGNLWGYADKKGNIRVPIQFEEAYPFIHQLKLLDPYFNPEYEITLWPELKHPIAIIKKDGLFGLIGGNGQILSPPVSPNKFQFDHAAKDAFWVRYEVDQQRSEDYESFRSALLYDGGSRITPFKYDYFDTDTGCGYQSVAGFISFGHAEPLDYFIVNAEKEGVLSIHGTEIIPPIWDSVNPGENGYTVVYSGLDTMMINDYAGAGYYMLNPKHQIVKKLVGIDYCMGYMGQGLWAISNNQKLYLINEKGEQEIEDYYSQFFGFNADGFAEVCDANGNWRIIDFKGTTIMHLEYEGQCQKYAEGYWKIDGGLYYLYDNKLMIKDKTGYKSAPQEITICGKKYWLFVTEGGTCNIRYKNETPLIVDFTIVEPISSLSDQWGRRFDCQILKVEKNSKIGVVDCAFKEIIPPQFQSFHLFYGPNLWMVRDSGKVGLFDAIQKRLIIPVKFDEIYFYPDYPTPLLAVRDDKLWGQYNLEGKEILPVIFEKNLFTSSYNSLIKSKKGWHVFDEQLKEIAFFSHLQLDELSQSNINSYDLGGKKTRGIAVNIKDKKALYDLNGQILIPPDYEDFRIYREYIIVKRENKFGVLLYPELCEFISIKYDQIDYLEGKFRLMRGKEHIYYDPQSHIKLTIYDKKYSGYGWLKEGRIAVSKDGKFGFIDEELNLVIPTQFKSTLNFSEGLAAVETDNFLWGFIDKQGEIRIKPQYAEVQNFFHGSAIARYYHADATVWSAIIDQNGTVLFTATEITRVGNFILISTGDDLVSVLDSNLQTIMDHCFIFNKNEQEGSLDYMADGHIGYLSPEGIKLSADYKLKRQLFPDGRIGISYYSIWGLQDQKGRWLIPLAPQWANFNQDGDNFIIRKQEKSALFDRNGIQKIPFNVYRLEIKNGFCEANIDEQVGLFDLNGKMIVPINYSDLEILPEIRLIKATTLDNKVGFFDYEGRQYFKD